eukprot:703883_1
MGIDLTNHFRVIVAEKLVEYEIDASSLLKPTKHEPLKFTLIANEVLSSIVSFREFLSAVRADYLDTGRYISARASHMSDSERARIDRDAVKFATEVARDIDQLKQLVGRDRTSQNCQEHHHRVVFYLYDKVKSITETVNNLRSARLAHAKQRLATHEFERTTTLERTSTRERTNSKSATVLEDGDAKEDVFMHENEETENSISFTEQEQLMFENENNSLLERYDHTVDQLRTSEKRMVEISDLMRLFSEKVVQQAQQIDSIHANATHSVQNVKDGNKELKTAMDRGVSARVLSLVIFILAGLSLLFLDWYT